jgi:hypothetical protein
MFVTVGMCEQAVEAYTKVSKHQCPVAEGPINTNRNFHGHLNFVLFAGALDSQNESVKFKKT